MPHCPVREVEQGHSPAHRHGWRAGCTAPWRVRRRAGSRQRCGCLRRGSRSSSPPRSGPSRLLRASGQKPWSARWHWRPPLPTGRSPPAGSRHPRSAGAWACGQRATGRTHAAAAAARARAARRGPARLPRGRPHSLRSPPPRARNPPHRIPPPAGGQRPARRLATALSSRAGTHRAPPRSSAPSRPRDSPVRAAPGRTG